MIKEIYDFLQYIWEIFFPDKNNKKIEAMDQIKIKKEQNVKNISKPIVQVQPILKPKIIDIKKVPIKYKFYPPIIFDTFKSQNIYQNIVVQKLFFSEPFHTNFVTLLKYWEQNNEYEKVKSNTILIKVDDNSTEVFKAYKKSELVFFTIDKVFKYTYDKYTNKDIENILIAILLYYLNNDKIKSAILKQYDDTKHVFTFLKALDNKNDELSFVFKFYNEAKQFCNTYPYVKSSKNSIQQKGLEYNIYKNTKKLYFQNEYY